MRLSAAQWIIFVSLVSGAIGLLLPWATALIASVTGLDAGDGKLFGGLLVAALMFGFLRIRSGHTAFAVLLLLTCLGMAGVAFYDLVNIWTSEPGPFGISVRPGSGLYLDAAAGIAAVVGSILDLRNSTKVIARSVTLPPS